MSDDLQMSMSVGDGEPVEFTSGDLKKVTAQLGSPHMKNTVADDAVIKDVGNVAGAELRAFIERIEKLEAEKKDLADAQKEVMAEAKGRGYDTKVLRKVIAIRKQDANARAEEEAVLEMYMAALGM